MSGDRVFVIVDPTVSAPEADLLRANGATLRRIREGWRPAERPSTATRAKGLLTRTAIAAGVAVLGLLMMRYGLRLPGLLLLVGVGGYVLLKSRWVIKPEEPGQIFDLSRRLKGRFLLLKDFDQAAWLLMTRTTDAIATVTASVVNAEGLLDEVRNRVVLPGHEWEIAQLLAQLTALRREHGNAVADGITGDVVDRMERALSASERAILARVEAIERYARHVAEADHALLARRRAEELEGRLRQYEDLAVESQADRLAVPEIESLAHEADLLEDALRRNSGRFRGFES